MIPWEKPSSAPHALAAPGCPPCGWRPRQGPCSPARSHAAPQPLVASACASPIWPPTPSRPLYACRAAAAAQVIDCGCAPYTLQLWVELWLDALSPLAHLATFLL